MELGGWGALRENNTANVPVMSKSLFFFVWKSVIFLFLCINACVSEIYYNICIMLFPWFSLVKWHEAFYFQGHIKFWVYRNEAKKS